MPRRSFGSLAVTAGRGLTAAVALHRELTASTLGRRVLRRRVVALLLAVAVGTTVTDLVGGAARVRARWGPTRTVVVARRDLPAGSELGPAAVVVQRWPAALAPGAVDVAPGRRTARPVAAGAALTSLDLAPAGRGPVAARLGPERAAVTVARGAAPVPVRPDDQVDLVRVAAAGRELTGRTLARRARVVAVDARTVTVEVRRSAAPGIAVAGAAGTVALVLVP